MTREMLVQLRAGWVLFRARVAESVRVRSSLVFLLGLPALLMLSLSLVFAEGHPFERRRVVTDCVDPRVHQALNVLHDSLAWTLEDRAHAESSLRTTRAELWVRCDSGRRVTLVYGQRSALLAQALTTQWSAMTVRSERWTLAKGAYAQGLLPGVIAFAVLFSGLFGMGPPMLRMRRQRLLTRLTLSRLRWSTFVLSQVSARALLTTGQVLSLTCVAHVLVKSPLSVGALLAVVCVAVLGVCVFAGLGVMLAAIVQHEDILSDGIAASATPLVLLSGAFFSVESLPSWLATVARALPSTVLVEACREALEHQRVLPGLALWAIAGLMVATASTHAIAQRHTLA
ncbi:MAG: ABC transporter permease [Deltaproteobacteria bacterium]|nr:ABC transporter permease [Deltaproteobacteria bacterium]